jgi:hypothetical protein
MNLPLAIALNILPFVLYSGGVAMSTIFHPPVTHRDFSGRLPISPCHLPDVPS